MKSDIDPESRESSCKARKFSIIEENAIYYDAGYVVQKLIGASLSEPHTSGSRWTFDRHVTENLRKNTESPTLVVVDGRSTVT